MKRTTAIILIILFILSVPITVLAEDDPVVSVLQIDTQNIYDGMEKSYTDGYTPTINNGTIRVVLPLNDISSQITDSKITVTPKISDTSNPIVLSNKQFTVNKTADPNYLVDFTLPLTKDRINGRYGLIIETEYKVGTTTNTQQFEIFFYITDGKKPETSQAQEKPTSQPIILIKSYNINPKDIKAGESFEVTVTLENTSLKKSVQNMLVKANCESTNLTLLNESSSIYIDKMDKASTLDIVLKYKSDLETPAGKHNISLSISCDTSKAETITAEGSVPVEITQPLRVELEVPKVASELNAGDTLPLTFNVMNLGRGKIYNVRVSLDAPGLIASASAFIGNMEPGTAGESDMKVFIGTKDMTDNNSEDKYGYVDGKFILIYEDERGNEYPEEYSFYTTINPPVISPVSNDVDETVQRTNEWWISIVIAAVILLAFIAFLLIRKNKKTNYEDI